MGGHLALVLEAMPQIVGDIHTDSVLRFTRAKAYPVEVRAGVLARILPEMAASSGPSGFRLRIEQNVDEVKKSG